MELNEYRCDKCDKLLCKGCLTDKDNMLEVKCRNCHNIQFFQGPDAEIIRKRAVLINQGLIPDTDK
ncbi:hypothetical protein HY311_00590 [Candidatus Nomurabacteria bacterium]|nr:hypothetical protein [Candidatus Nomurabacteria bacterium]